MISSDCLRLIRKDLWKIVVRFEEVYRRLEQNKELRVEDRTELLEKVCLV